MTAALKRHALALLVGLNAVLLCILVACWVTPRGALRGVTWAAPAPRLTDFASQLPTLPGPAPADIANFVGLLERPLFSPTRRPPPPAAPQGASAAPVDNLSTAILTGTFNSASASGLIMHMAGKDVRVQLHQTLEGWTLKSVTGREATFTSGGQSRVLQLKRADVSQALPGTLTPGGAEGSAPNPLPFIPAPVPIPVPVNRPQRAEATAPVSRAPVPNGAAPSAPGPSFGSNRP